VTVELHHQQGGARSDRGAEAVHHGAAPARRRCHHSGPKGRSNVSDGDGERAARGLGITVAEQPCLSLSLSLSLSHTPGRSGKSTKVSSGASTSERGGELDACSASTRASSARAYVAPTTHSGCVNTSVAAAPTDTTASLPILNASAATYADPSSRQRN
jgi:hypothetical protein